MQFREFRDKVKMFPFFGSEVATWFSASPQSMRNQLSRWKKLGWIIEFKKGMYALSENERRANFSLEALAVALYPPSYISLERALSAHGLIPERVVMITAVTTRKTKEFRNRMGCFNYRHLKPALFFGFSRKKDEFGCPYFLAEPEKALLDYLYLSPGGKSRQRANDLVGHLRMQNLDKLDKKKLRAYARRFRVKKIDGVIGGI